MILFLMTFFSREMLIFLKEVAVSQNSIFYYVIINEVDFFPHSIYILVKESI